MGCFFTKAKNQETVGVGESEAPKTYSWDKKERVNPADYTIENLNGGEAGRVPGSISGQQFILQNCKDANIYLLDHINTLTIDDCTDCTIFVGPTTGSVFVRDCRGCIIAVACGQLRTRDCCKVDLLLLCQSQPVIEASTKMRFGCLQASYPQLLDQFHSAGLSVFNNNWCDVYDFTPVDGETNWSPLTSHLTHAFTLPQSDTLASVGLSIGPEKSVVPLTIGRPALSPGSDTCLVFFFPHPKQYTTAMNFIAAFTSRLEEGQVQWSRELRLEESDLKKVVGEGPVAVGPLVALLCVGQEAHTVCTQLGQETNANQPSPLIRVAPNTAAGQAQISALLSTPNMNTTL